MTQFISSCPSNPCWFYLNLSDLSREEAFTGGLPEFPSLDNGTTTNGDDDDDLSLGLPLPQPQQPVKSKRAPPPENAVELVSQMAGDVIAAAVTAAMQERIEAAIGFTPSEDLRRSRLEESSRLLEMAEESDSEAEDFELLDQSELEQLEGELGLGEEKAREAGQEKSESSASPGFFSKLLRRH